MNRILRGAVVFAASALAWGCNTEPDIVTGGDPEQIVATPAIVFVDQGDEKEILLRLVDKQGSSLDGPISVTTSGAAAGVTVDSLFRPVYAPDGTLSANTFNTELRLAVSGDALGVTTITVEAEGETLAIPVTVLPTAIEAAVSDAAPDVGEPITITAPSGFTFGAESNASFATGGEAELISAAADGSSITVLPQPGSSGTLTVSNVVPGYAPNLSLPFPIATEVAVTEVSLFSSDDPLTAPSVTAPAVGETLTFRDQSIAVDQFTHIVITDPNTVIDFTVDWVNYDEEDNPTDADIDIWLCDEACTTAGDPGGFGGATGDHPEEHTVTFATPGTYTLQYNLYGGAAPDIVIVSMTRTQ
jgi:hypothetical protein